MGENDTDKGLRSIGEQPTMQGGSREIRIGMKIGPDARYVIKDILGKGGMGEVYLALDEISKTEVAIKLVPREVSTSEDEMEQVRKNFALVRNLHHPNIAAVTALERLPSGEFILVMEAILGRKTLQKDRLSRDNERLTAPEAIKVCKQVADALDYAHSQKVIHRDVKPSNVLLTPDGNVKLTDFGLAAQILSSMNRVSLLPTRTSGTRPYMAPEQWEGRIQDAKTDQWALAVLFYELVTGRLPFPADDLGVLERQILEKTPSKPESLTGNQWTSVRRALSKEKEARFENCGAFVEALARDTRQRLPRQDNNRKPFFFVAVLAVLLVGAAFAVFRQFHASATSKTDDGPGTPKVTSTAPSVDDTTRQQLDAERVAREAAEAKLRQQQQAAEQAQQETQRLQKEKDEADKARIVAEETARQQKAEADRLASEAEAKRIRDAETTARQRAAEEQRQRQIEAEQLAKKREEARRKAEQEEEGVIPAEPTSSVLTLQIESGSIAGQPVSRSSPTVTVKPGQELRGTLNIRVRNDMGANAIAPLAGTSTWGTPSKSAWQIEHWVGTGTTTHKATVDLTAPNTEGSYYIVFALAGTYNIEQIMSGTHPGWQADWSRGNNVARLPRAYFRKGISQGWVPFDWYSPEGPKRGTLGMAAIEVNVSR